MFQLSGVHYNGIPSDEQLKSWHRDAQLHAGHGSDSNIPKKPQDRARADKESQSQGKQSQFRYVNELSKDQPLR